MPGDRDKDSLATDPATYRTLGATTSVVYGDPDALARDLFDVEIAQADAWGEGLPAGAARTWAEASEATKDRFRARARTAAA